MSKKKISRRKLAKNPALAKMYNSKIRQEYIDLDYIDKLDDTKKICKLPNGTMVTELEYMNIFMSEWNSGGVGKQSEAKKNKLHRTAELVKDCTDRTNGRNRDSYSIAKATNTLYYAEDIIKDMKINDRDDLMDGINEMEDAIINALDHAKETGNTSGDTNEE
jgi:hypothetical protein